MKTEEARQLKQLITEEIQLRAKWRKAVKQLQDLVQPATEHNLKCCKFWEHNLSNAEEIAVVMDDNTTYKIVKPDRESASVEAYLPYGMEFSECKVIDLIKQG